MKILGLWDGHDSGAAIIENGKILFAINEERLTRRKLEVQFPKLSIEEIVKTFFNHPSEIEYVAFSTTDPSKTLTRVFPALKEEYYLVRRRLRKSGRFTDIKRAAKYFITALPPNSLSQSISSKVILSNLRSLNISPKELHHVDHHHAHASAAAFTWQEEIGAVITLDGIGDGASGSVWEKKGGKLSRLSIFSGKESLGLLFELATYLLNMRELEDEGKVMALANYITPLPWEQNPLKDLFYVKDLKIHAKISTRQLFTKLKQILWTSSPEKFAFRVQQTFEQTTLQLFKNVREATGLNFVAYAGGGAANVKANMILREQSRFKSLYVYPHMGDGGLAVGAALAFNNFKDAAFTGEPLSDVQLGLKWSTSEIENFLSAERSITYSAPENYIFKAAEIIERGEILFWFQGRMEYGPRSLGGRSILARPDSIAIKDHLNNQLKRREWFQPFCPTMFREEAEKALVGFGGQNEAFMCGAYQVKEEYAGKLAGAMQIDGTCRPQVLEDEAQNSELGQYYLLLKEVQQRLGFGALLNTSFNLHGEPLVCNPIDAIRAFKTSGAGFLMIDKFLVERI